MFFLRQEWPNVVESLMLIVLLIRRDNSTLICFAFADQLCLCIKVKAIETSMDIILYAMYMSTVMPGLNDIA